MDILEDSYRLRRQLILSQNPPSIRDLREMYPLLFNPLEIQNELDRVLADTTSKKFFENIELYAEVIWKLVKDDDPVLLITRQKQKEFSSPFQKKYAVEVGSILILTSLLNEHRHYLKLEDTQFQVSTFPYIEAQTKLSGIFDQCIFKVYAEQTLICEVTNFKEAILCMIACYHIFNIEYNPENFNTLVAMEKLYLEQCETELDHICTFTKKIIIALQLKALARGTILFEAT